MTEGNAGAYVDAACAVHGIALREGERARVIAHFMRLGVLAQSLVDLQLVDDVEMAPVFEP